MRINNPMEIFRHLPHTNCRQCNEKTCLAFSVEVFKGRKQLSRCPYVKADMIDRLSGDTGVPDDISVVNTIDEDMDAAVDRLKQKIAQTDLAAAAGRIGAVYSENILLIRVFDKPFSIDAHGNILTQLHLNPWILFPVLNYVLNSEGRAFSGKWAPFRELSGGRDRYPIFKKRVENPMKTIADADPALFSDILEFFLGKNAQHIIDADISMILHPLPKVPVMICYTLPEEGIESGLSLLFDAQADKNLDMDSFYTLSAGIVNMFEKIAARNAVGSDAWRR